MRNFTGEYPQGIERVGWGCKISMRNILMLSKTWDVDAIIHDRQAKSICRFKEKQVADTLIPKRASATMNIKAVQIHQLSKKHLRQQINSGYRYIRSQKSKSLIAPPISITVHLQARKDYAIQRIGVGLARRSWAGVYSLFLTLRASWTK